HPFKHSLDALHRNILMGSELEFETPMRRRRDRETRQVFSRSALRQTARETFSNRAAWLRQQLDERDWSERDPCKFSGPDHKTIAKISAGLPVRDDVLERLANALSRGGKAVTLVQIPRD